MKVSETKLFDLPAPAFRLAVLMASGHAAYRFPPGNDSYPAFPFLPRLCTGLDPSWLLDDPAQAFFSGGPCRLLSTPSPDVFDRVWTRSARRERRRQAAAREEMAGYYHHLVDEYPAAGELLASPQRLTSRHFDPLLGFGVQFRDHGKMQRVATVFLAALASNPSVMPGGDLLRFRVDLLEDFWRRLIADLEARGFEIASREEPVIGAGAWLALALVKMAAVFGYDCYRVSTRELYADPLFYLNKHPVFGAPARLSV